MLRSLAGTVDFYKCLHIKLPTLPTPFETILAESLLEWTSQKLKAVWLLVPNSQLELVSVCSNFGFYPHHVNSSGIMMAKWLENRPNSLPTYSTHYIGVGGVLFDPDNRILLIKNRYSGIGVSNWRPPGGLVEANELVLDAAVREVKEETNIDSQPIGVLGLREKRNYQFERPDIYFLVLLQPLSLQFTMDTEEITHCAWMDFPAWLDEDLPGDARKMMKNIYSDRSIPPFNFLSSICMKYSEMTYASPNYNATHYYHMN